MGEVLEMIRNRKVLEKFEQDLARRERSSLKKNLEIVDALYQEAVALGVFPLKNPLEGIEIDIKFAKAAKRVR